MSNPLRGVGLSSFDGLASGEIVTDVSAALALYKRCPAHNTTPLRPQPELAAYFDVEQIDLKLEENRMGLGSFKALGAAHAIAKLAATKADPNIPEAMASALKGTTFICASAGNHGLSMAAGAPLFGAKAVVVLAQTVPQAFAVRLEAKGATVVRAGATYEESMDHSRQLAQANGWHLLSDGSWAGYSDPPRDVMEGYLIMGHEVADAIEKPPTHIFLQAGVGGLAAACAAAARDRWGNDACIVVVEPSAAPALIESVRAGRCVDTQGPVSNMGRLDCKTPSHLALKYLAREADLFVTVDDDMVQTTVELLSSHDIHTTPSGAAGLSALHWFAKEPALRVDSTARVLCYISEASV